MASFAIAIQFIFDFLKINRLPEEVSEIIRLVLDKMPDPQLFEDSMALSSLDEKANKLKSRITTSEMSSANQTTKGSKENDKTEINAS